MNSPGIRRVTFVLLAALLAACSPRSGSVRPDPSPRSGGSLTIALIEPDSLDPSKAVSRSALIIFKQVCDTLVRFDPRTGALKPGIAESWTASADAKIFTFKIRPGARFHNDRAVTAEDFAYSLSRFVTSSPQYFYLDQIAGYKDVREQRSPTLSGVKAVDPQTLEISTVEPFAELPAVLSHPAAGAPIPREEVDKGADAFAARPTCSGPFQVLNPWVKGQPLKLNRSARYEPPTGSKAPLLDEIVVSGVPDEESAYRLFTTKRAEVADVPIARLAAARKAGHVVESAANGLFAYLGLPVSKAPFDNAELRKALSLAVDRRQIVEGLLAGSRQAADGFLPPSVGKSGVAACRQTVKPGADVAASKSAVGKSGLDVTTIKPVVHFNEGGGHEGWLPKVVDSWRKGVGVEATLQGQERDAYHRYLIEPGADGPFRLAWNVAYPSPESLFGPLFVSASPDNFSRFANADFDASIKQARTTIDDEAREDLYMKAAQILCDQMPVIPMWFGMSHVAYSTAVAGETDLDIFGDPRLREVGLRG